MTRVSRNLIDDISIDHRTRRAFDSASDREEQGHFGGCTNALFRCTSRTRDTRSPNDAGFLCVSNPSGMINLDLAIIPKVQRPKKKANLSADVDWNRSYAVLNVGACLVVIHQALFDNWACCFQVYNGAFTSIWTFITIRAFEVPDVTDVAYAYECVFNWMIRFRM